MWSPQQDAALKAVVRWLRDPYGAQVFRIFGWAGVGKTTLAKEIATFVSGRVLYGAFTGKAALVLRSKGCFDASTIHSLIYKAEELADGSARFILNPNSLVATAKLLILDEVSMVGHDLAHDVLSFGTRVLVLGDPGQLPPIRGTGYFTDTQPDVMLTEIHRQAADNPIIRMSMDVRAGKALAIGNYGDSKVMTGRPDPAEVLASDQVLVGMNRTRRGCNNRIRQLKAFVGTLPQRGDRLVCLRNNRERCLLNGGLWTAKTASQSDRIVNMEVMSEDDASMTKPVPVSVPEEFFHGEEEKLEIHKRRKFDEFDFGYALTVHKSQGSQWPSVMLFDESSVFREHRARHLYTAITRAADRITVVV